MRNRTLEKYALTFLLILGLSVTAMSWDDGGAWGEFKLFLKKFSCHIIPRTDSTYDVGSPTYAVRTVHTDGVVADTGVFTTSVKVNTDKVTVSEETNLQCIMQGSVTVTTSNYDGTATITYGNTFTATPTVVVTVAEALNSGYDSIVNVEDIGMDTCIVRLIDCVDDDSSISVGYIVMGDE